MTSKVGGIKGLLLPWMTVEVQIESPLFKVNSAADLENSCVFTIYTGVIAWFI